MMKKIVLIICMVISLAGIAFAADLKIQSNKQEFSDKDNKIFLDGNVKVKMDDLNITSPKAQVEIDPQTKKIKNVQFLENAYSYQVKANKKHEIKANILKLSLLDKVLTAEGNAQSSVTENNKPLVIITADKQEYNKNTNVMKASGQVIVYYKDIETFSNSAIVDLTKQNEIKRIQLIGNGIIKQKDNKISADRLSYDTNKEEAIAQGNVFTDFKTEDGSPLKVWSNYQMYSDRDNYIVASGNTVIKFKDYTARGPKASVFPDKSTNKLNEVVFTGRSKIEQQGRTIEADRIKMTLNPKDFAAEGNVTTIIPNVQGMEN